MERVLLRVTERLIAEGGRLLVVAADEAALARLDELLWNFAADSFLPHARAGEGRDIDQPVLLSADCTAANGARNLLIADGLWRDEALGFDRAFYLFDGDTLDAARATWRALGDRDGVERRYWKQDDHGKWVRGP